VGREAGVLARGVRRGIEIDGAHKAMTTDEKPTLLLGFCPSETSWCPVAGRIVGRSGSKACTRISLSFAYTQN